jgi:pimeloyl-[acyl-carrier protein] synthase
MSCYSFFTFRNKQSLQQLSTAFSQTCCDNLAVMSESATSTAPAGGSMFPAGPEFFADPYRFYRMLQTAAPVLWRDGLFGVGGWVVTDYSVCSAGLRSKLFIKEGQRVLPPEKLKLIPQENESEYASRRRQNMLFRDPPDHTRLRGLVSLAFTPRMTEQLRPRIAEIAEQLVQAAFASSGPVDLIRDVAFPLPIIVIAEMLGVPAEDRDQFKSWSTDLTNLLNPSVTAEEMAQGNRSLAAVDAYLLGVVAQRRREPRADLISALIHAQESGDKLTDDELVATCRLILNAGHETTVNLIGNGMLALLRNPESMAALAADPLLLPNAVEEFLRYDSPVQFTSRFASEDTPLGEGNMAKRGDVVVFVMGAANRDGRHFDDPDRLDLRRENAHTHLSFGGGIHYCLGAPLARLEGEIAIGTLLRHAPEMRLAAGKLTWRPHMVLRGLRSLPVTV